MGRFQYRHYLLALLTVVAAFNYLDRGVLALSMESIKLEFQLSDSQLGFMSGFAFALFYAVAGIPIARWADVGNRNHVVTLTTFLWSLMVAISGVVTNFGQLLLARVGVAIGESGCIPPAQSLISDYFNRRERPHAMAIYWMSSPISTILAYLVGGWLIEQFGWRITFILIGLPGILLAILVKLTLTEPRLIKQIQVQSRAEDRTGAKPMPLRQVLSVLYRKPAFRHVVMLFCISFFFGAGIGIWIPAFFMRSYGMEAAELGTWLGFTWGLGGVLFTYLGGAFATRYAPNKESRQLKGIAYICVLSTFFHICCYLSSDKYAALIFVSVVIGALIPMTSATIYSAIQSLVEERMRAVALAFIFMAANLIGLGVGPVVVGLISDSLSPFFGTESLRYALLLFSPGYLWCAYHCWQASRIIEQEIRVVEAAGKVIDTAIRPKPNRSDTVCSSSVS